MECESNNYELKNIVVPPYRSFHTLWFKLLAFNRSLKLF